MGRKVLASELIENEYNRRITFRKRRMGVVKKAIQLSKLSGCSILLSIFCSEDGSLIEYTSGDEARKNKSDPEVH